MAEASWFAAVDGSGYSAWAAILPQPEADLTCVYTVKTRDSVYQDCTASVYRILGSVTNTTPTITYDVESTLAYISGTVSLPFAAVVRDFVDTYTIPFGGVSRDLTDSYHIVNYAEDFLTYSYDIWNAAESDAVLSYDAGGATTRDITLDYNMVISVEQDYVGEFVITGSAYNDVSIVYTVVTNPLTAAREEAVTYDVHNYATQDRLLAYSVLTETSRTLAGSYRVLRSAERDTDVAYDLSGQVLNDTTHTYEVFALGQAQKDAIFAYDVDSLVVRVPNIVGYSRAKAKKVLEQNNLVLGQVTYN